MRVWLVTIGEPVPLEDGARDRLHRTGTFAHLLAEAGHEVVWWTSTFNHFRKEHLFAEDQTFQVNERLEIRLLHGCGYRRNVSLARFRDHYQIGKKFLRLAAQETPPDVIVSALPTIELSLASVRYGAQRGIPVVVDIRDLWPDIFVDTFPAPLRWAARLGLDPLFRQTRAALQGCTSIVGVSPGYLQWGLQFARRGPRDTDAVFPLGYRRPIFDPQADQAAVASLRQQGVDPTKAICWFVGMFGRTYDLQTVLGAAQECQRRQLDHIQFVLSGQGDSYQDLVQQASGLSNLVFTGWINTPQIAWLMQAAQVGLMAYAPGAPQGYPNKLFEYMSAGIPIVSSLQGETAALLRDEDCGLSYRPGDAAGLTAALVSLVQDEARRREMGRNSQRLFQDRFRGDKIYADLIAHLERLVRLPGQQGRRRNAA